jgi:hypothetical protein
MIHEPGVVAVMFWIRKHQQTLLMGVLIARLSKKPILNPT